MLKEKKLYMCFVDLEKAFFQSTKESVGIGIEVKRNTRCFG